MEKYFAISFTVQPQGRNSVPVTLALDSEFNVVYEHFLWYIENSVIADQFIDNVLMTYGDAVLATSVPEILAIGAGITDSKFEIESTKGTKYKTLKEFKNSIDELLANKSPVYFVKIKGERLKPYKVLKFSVEYCKLRELVNSWYDAFISADSVINDIEINPVLPNSRNIDCNWKIDYCLSDEVQRAYELIDTEPKKVKDILFVMQYMLIHYSK